MEHMCFFVILVGLPHFPTSTDRMHMNLLRWVSLNLLNTGLLYMLFDNIWFGYVLLMFCSQIDEWLEHAPVFSLGSAFENACKHLDDFLQSRTFLVGYSLSIADVAIWSGLAGRSF
jgi:hypothetical protein